MSSLGTGMAMTRGDMCRRLVCRRQWLLSAARDRAVRGNELTAGSPSSTLRVFLHCFGGPTDDRLALSFVIQLRMHEERSVQPSCDPFDCNPMGMSWCTGLAIGLAPSTMTLVSHLSPLTTPDTMATRRSSLTSFTLSRTHPASSNRTLLVTICPTPSHLRRHHSRGSSGFDPHHLPRYEWCQYTTIYPYAFCPSAS